MQSRSKKIRLISGTVRIGLFLCGFVAAVELCSRLDDKYRFDAPLWRPYCVEQLTAFDGAGLKYNIPNASFEKWRHNSRGFRGPEVAPGKPADTVRVVCMGSSESYGLFESQGAEWPAQLQQLLPAPQWEVINASVVGLDVRQYGPYLEKRVFPLHPDIVVLVVNPNRYATIFAREHRGTRSLPASPGATERRVDAAPPPVANQFRFLARLKLALKQGMQKSFPAALQRYQRWEMGRQVAEIEKARLKGEKPLERLQPGCEAQFHNDVAALVELLRARGIEVVLTSYPTLMDAGNLHQHQEIFLDARRFGVEYSLAGLVDVRERLNAALAELSASEGTQFADLSRRLPRDTGHFGDNVHYTDKGARLVAETVADTLHRSSVLVARNDAGRKP